MSIFDICVITASDERQASVFRALLARRLEEALYPREIRFEVCADPPDGRVGSGGGTLRALRRMRERGSGGRGFSRALVIHAGGESRRLPAYVPEGKLFAPLPTPSSSLVQPAILDHMLALYLRYPWRDGELIVSSGDVVIDFETELLDLPDAALCGFAAPESFELGARHGVFAFDPLAGTVRDYFQKAPRERLEREARIEGREACALDLGIASFRGEALAALEELASRKAGMPFRFDLYLELMMASLGSLGFDGYLSRVAGSTRLSRGELAELYELFHPCGLAGVLVKSPLFLHFGSAREYADSCLRLREKGHASFYAFPSEELSPQAGGSLVADGCLETELVASGPLSYAENCARVRIRLEGENMLVGLRDLELGESLPRGTCIDERRVDDGGRTRSIRLVYHVDDSFKPVPSLREARFCGSALASWLADRSLSPADLGIGEGRVDLYELPLFTASVDPLFLSGYWRSPGDPKAWARAFLASERVSLSWANAKSDALQRDKERSGARAALLSARLATGGFFAVSAGDLSALVATGLDTAPLVERYRHTDDPLLKAYRGSALAKAGIEGLGVSERVELDFASASRAQSLRVAVKLDQIVWARSPARLDLAGGWTDTPPYTNRYGGAVVNVAADLCGQSPIQVFVRRTNESFVRVHSIDLGLTETIEKAGALRAYKDPASPFCLPKACLCLLGLGSLLGDDESLAGELAASGGGLEITMLCAIPKGSGLGTSSILAGTILGALERFFGLPTSPERLFLQVLEVEQMLTTGGGWQDQIGGLVGGVKYIEAGPGLRPRALIHQLDPWAFEDEESAGLMTLYYTGVTRLAKTILKEVVERINGMERSYLFTHRRIAALALEARDAISLRDLEALGRVVSESFRENQLVHASTTNAEIDALSAAAAPYVRGMKLLGAGGGGFALFLSPDRERTEALRELLARDFEDERARIVAFSLNKRGLQVTVS